MEKGEIVTKEKKKCPCCHHTLIINDVGRCAVCGRIIKKEVVNA